MLTRCLAQKRAFFKRGRLYRGEFRMVSEREPVRGVLGLSKPDANSCLRELSWFGRAFSSSCFWVLENGLRLVLRTQLVAALPLNRSFSLSSRCVEAETAGSLVDAGACLVRYYLSDDRSCLQLALLHNIGSLQFAILLISNASWWAFKGMGRSGWLGPAPLNL
ncbi:UNVERIFIED_CONTAM: hypothetical protein Sangu_2992800 [Sesamum angustifolium]|uniref:Uncharacterized protein n=1 Tax=Sesamum angustifolium TaxID=2727405 RepID=A0AAW2KP22_9LAMI